MFSRIVTMRPKSNSITALMKALDEQVLPLLRKQEGFRDEICLLSSDTKKAIVISFWDRKEQAEAYGRTVYPKVLETVEKHLDDTPMVKNYEVFSSTFYKMAIKEALV